VRSKTRRRRRRAGSKTPEPITKWFESDGLPAASERGVAAGPVPEPLATHPGRRARRGRHSNSGTLTKEKRRRIRKPPSPRRTAQRRLRRERRARLVRRTVPVVVAAMLIGTLAYRQLSSDDAPAPRKAAATTPAPSEVTNTLLVGTEREGEAAAWLALLSYDPSEQRGAIVYIPAHTAVEVPGRGLQPLGNALESGGMSLLMVSAESLLGVEINHFERMTRAGAAALFENLGSLTVDVPGDVRMSAGQDNARVLFTEGLHELGPKALVDFLYTDALEGDDVELGARHLAFWDALLDGFHANPTVLGASVVAAGDAIRASGTGPSENARLLESLAGLAGEDLTLTILPVRQVSVGGSELYEADTEEIESFMDETLSSFEAGRADVEVQVLNGNGSPGIGQEVAEALGGEGFRVVLSGNARKFNHKATTIVTYDASPEGIAAAKRVRQLLGVGRVLVSAQEQGIVSVDLTIVVGKDFLRIR
jgi:polyisoprenyl-teichoic acid--peptidoglycan teichoic acid transferase